MSLTRCTCFWGFFLVLLLILTVDDPVGADKGKGANNHEADSPATGLTCVRWSQQVVYLGLGYNHLVHLKNTCKAAAACQVTTDVNPDPIAVELVPQQKTTVTTFRGSPARVFQAKVSCTGK